MKKPILTALILIFAITAGATASEVTLEWNATDPAPDGYRVYLRVSGDAFDYSSPAWTGTGTQAKVAGLDPGTYFFVVRAYVGNQESANSNEVEYTVPTSGTVPVPGDLSGEKTQLDRIEEKIDRILSAFSLVDAPTFAYCGNPDSKIFHKSSHWCGQGAVTFSNRQPAIDAGYTPCGVCKP